MGTTTLDSKGNPIPVAAGISPDRTSLSGGNASLITNAAGPNMTPAPPIQQGPAAAPSTQSSPDQQQGLFSKIGSALKQYAPVVSDVANHLAAAAGNYAPLEFKHQQDELALKQQNQQLQQTLAQSTLQTQDVGRQRTQQEIEQARQSFQTPQEKIAAEIAAKDTENRNALTANEQLGPGTVASAPLPGGGAQQVRIHGTKAEPIMLKPATPDGQPTPLMSQPKLHPLNPIMQADGKWVVPQLNATTGRIDHYENLDGTPAAGLSTVDSNTTSKNSIQHDANNNLVNVPETSTTTKRTAKVLPGVPSAGGGGAAPPTMPKIPMASGVPQSGAATPIAGTDGQPLHAPVSPAARKTIGQIYASENILNSVLPELDAKIKASPGGANTLWDSMTQRAAWAEYQHAGIVPNNVDPTLAKILPVVAQLQIVAASPYMNGSRNFQFMQQIQQHIPNPEKDSPALMVEKAHAMLQTLPMIRKGILQGEGITPPPAETGASSPNAAPSKIQIHRDANGRIIGIE